jgi:predicted dehydrogenase
MSDTVRVGVVSTSWWADEMYLPALKSHPQAEAAAICGRDRQRAEEIAARYGIPGVFGDYREMIDRGDLDAVIVGVPDDVHHAVTLYALKSGLHVLCDKPLALNAREAREMAETAEAVGVKHAVLFTYRWMPFFRYARDLIQQGCVGRLYHAEFRYLASYARRKAYAWRLDRKRANGVLGDLGSHMIDMARWLVGDITRVSAQLKVCVERPGLEGGPIDPANDSALVLTEFAHGAQGVIQASCVAYMAERGMEQQVKLYGEDGTLEVTMPYEGSEAGAIIRVARSHEDQFQRLLVPDSYWGEADRSRPFSIFKTQPVGVRLFVDAILNNRPIEPDFYDGYKVQQVIDAALQSHASGCAVSIENTA